MLIGATGNTSIIIIILKNKLLRLQPTNLFLLNMAVSDLLNLCVNPIFYLFRRDVLFTNYYLGRISCLITPVFTGKTFLWTVQWCRTYIYVPFFLLHSDNICIRSIEPHCHNFKQSDRDSIAQSSRCIRIESLYCLHYFGCDLVNFNWNSCTNLLVNIS